MAGVVSIEAVAAGMDQPWRPVDLVRANDTMVRMARFEGSFDWHDHDEDELFLCWSGSFRVELEGGDRADLHPGELFVVPAHVRHRPVADAGPAFGVMVERPETTQRGSLGRENG